MQVERPALGQSGRMPPKRECQTESPLCTGDAECTSTHRATSHQPGSCGERSSVVTHYSPSMEPTGTHDSSIHGSVPCSSWEIISGLETWSPAQRGEKKESVCNKEKAAHENAISPLCKTSPWENLEGRTAYNWHEQWGSGEADLKREPLVCCST